MTTISIAVVPCLGIEASSFIYQIHFSIVCHVPIVHTILNSTTIRDPIKNRALKTYLFPWQSNILWMPLRLQNPHALVLLQVGLVGRVLFGDYHQRHQEVSHDHPRIF